MKRLHRLFAFSLLSLYLSFTPWVIPPRAPLPERVKPHWRTTIQRIRTIQVYTPVELMSAEAEFGPI
jgi:hypothetical protein